VAWFWWLIAAVVIVLWVAAIVDIIRRRHAMSGAKLFTWLILVLVFPVLGTVVYFLVHGAGTPMPTPADAQRATRHPDGSP
jgi:hypothetical protein